MHIRIRFELLTDELKSVVRKDHLMSLDEVRMARCDTFKHESCRSAQEFEMWLKRLGYLK